MISMFAYVQWVGTLTNSENGLKTFQQWRTHKVIDVSAIDRCAGFFKLEMTQYVIIDREGQVALR